MELRPQIQMLLHQSRLRFHATVRTFGAGEQHFCSGAVNHAKKSCGDPDNSVAVLVSRDVFPSRPLQAHKLLSSINSIFLSGFRSNHVSSLNKSRSRWWPLLRPRKARETVIFSPISAGLSRSALFRANIRAGVE